MSYDNITVFKGAGSKHTHASRILQKARIGVFASALAIYEVQNLKDGPNAARQKIHDLEHLIVGVSRRLCVQGRGNIDSIEYEMKNDEALVGRLHLSNGIRVSDTMIDIPRGILPQAIAQTILSKEPARTNVPYSMRLSEIIELPFTDFDPKVFSITRGKDSIGKECITIQICSEYQPWRNFEADLLSLA